MQINYMLMRMDFKKKMQPGEKDAWLEKERRIGVAVGNDS